MRKLIFVLSILFILGSCQQIVDNYLENQEQENYVNPYTGKYAGTISGNLNGSITFDVAKSGSVTIIRNINGKAESVNAFVNNDGAFQEAMGTAEDMKFFGNLQTKNGTLKQGTLTGNWSVSKQ